MITRAHMRRQLRATGGITNARQGYGIGSWVKERVRKIIPNELASVASKAAPFVAPFFPGAAAAMRGIGRFDKRGSISDAMKQAALTYAGGKGARYLGGVDKSLMPGQGTTGFDYSMDKFRQGPVGRVWDSMMPKRQSEDLTKSKDIIKGRKFDPTDPIGYSVPTEATGDLSVKGIWKKFQSLPASARTAIVGVGTGAITGVAQWFENQYREQEPGETIEEYLAARKKDVGKLMRTYMDNYYAHDATYSALDDAGKDAFVAKYNMNKGGRVGYQYGGGGADYMPTDPGPMGNPPVIEEIEDMREFRIANPDIEDVTDYSLEYPSKKTDIPLKFKPNKRTMNPALMKRMIELMLQGIPRHKVREEAEKQLRQEPYINERMGMGPSPILEASKGGRVGYAIGSPEKQMEAGAPPIIYEGNMDPRAQNQRAGLPSRPGPMQMAAHGGRIGYRFGPGPVMDPRMAQLMDPRMAQPQGLRGLSSRFNFMPGPPRMAEDGLEYDMSETGGFQPLGAQEGKDDVKANLAKNEFVFTADAVRAAGGGSIQKGAQRMYDTMKKLERRVS